MKGRLWVAVLAAIVGVCALALWFGTYWPGKPWTVTSRAQFIDKGRQAAARFGVDVREWNAYLVVRHARAVNRSTPRGSLVVEITYRAPSGKPAVETRLDSDGRLKYWRADASQSKRYSSNAAAAQQAFNVMAGSQAASYEKPLKSFGEEDNEEEFEFKRTADAHSDFRGRIKVTVKNSAVERVRLSENRGSDDDEDDSDESEDYWSFFSAAYGLIYSVASVAVIAIFVLWKTRKALSLRFPLRLALGVFVCLLVIMWAGNDREKAHSVYEDHNTPGVSQVFVSLAVLVFAAVGRGISETARPKWISLEELCWLTPLSKPSGSSFLAGLLFAPFWISLPFLISRVNWFPGSWMVPYKAELLYSRTPLLDSIDISLGVGLLLFFGFILPAMQRLIHIRWIMWPVTLPIGAAFFANMPRLMSGSATVSLLTGALAFVLFWFVWSQFDLLALFTMQIAGGFVLGLFILGQKGQASGSLIVGLAGVLLAAFWCYWRGQALPIGDPLATIPPVTGFRAEREKLLAEFSVARRAQQDMLPQAPPAIPGYSIAAICIPSLEVGGDLYDFLELRDGRIGIGVADVSGKGVPAALYMTLTKGLLSAVTKSSSQIGPVMEEVNRHLNSVTRKKVFVTMALGFLDKEKRVLECVRAGHNPVVWRQQQNNFTTLVSPPGIGLGITAGRIFGIQLKAENLQLSEGDAVVFYSDGITEAMNRDLEQFGDERLMQAVAKTDSMDATATRDSILSEVNEFLAGVHPQDDMTLVVLRVGEQE